MVLSSEDSTTNNDDSSFPSSSSIQITSSNETSIMRTPLVMWIGIVFYLGKDFHGFQRQNRGLVSIQGLLEEAVRDFVGKMPSILRLTSSSFSSSPPDLKIKKLRSKDESDEDEDLDLDEEEEEEEEEEMGTTITLEDGFDVNKMLNRLSVVSSGRTDSGTNASRQFIQFRIPPLHSFHDFPLEDRPPTATSTEPSCQSTQTSTIGERLRLALNQRLPREIRILKLTPRSPSIQTQLGLNSTISLPLPLSQEPTSASSTSTSTLFSFDPSTSSSVPLHRVPTKSSSRPFHVQRDIARKRYSYYVGQGRFCSSWERTCWYHYKPLDLPLMREALNKLQGEHYFDGFYSGKSSEKNGKCTRRILFTTEISVCSRLNSERLPTDSLVVGTLCNNVRTKAPLWNDSYYLRPEVLRSAGFTESGDYLPPSNTNGKKMKRAKRKRAEQTSSTSPAEGEMEREAEEEWRKNRDPGRDYLLFPEAQPLVPCFEVPISLLPRFFPTSESYVLKFTVVGNGFLRHMVRRIVGTVLQIGTHKRPLSDIEALLALGENQNMKKGTEEGGITKTEEEAGVDSNGTKGVGTGGEGEGTELKANSMTRRASRYRNGCPFQIEKEPRGEVGVEAGPSAPARGLWLEDVVYKNLPPELETWAIKDELFSVYT